MNSNIINLIARKLRFVNKHRLKHTCRYYYQSVKIRNIPTNFIDIITDDILSVYRDIDNLSVRNDNITDLNHLTDLKRLIINKDSILTNDGIKECLLLENLTIIHNQNITSILCFKKLKIYILLKIIIIYQMMKCNILKKYNY